MLVRYLKRTLHGTGKVVAADCSEFAPALYEADCRRIIPAITDEAYLDSVLALCREEQINAVISLIDPEVCFLAAHAETFREIGVSAVVNDAALCELAMDKAAMYRWLIAHGYPCLKFWTEIKSFQQAVRDGEVRFPVVSKPVRGSGSDSVKKLFSLKEAECLMMQEPESIIQEWIGGQEIGVDLYADLITGEVVSVFAKRKLKMRAGETDQAVSFRDPRLFAFLERFVTEAGFCGVIDIDLVEHGGCFYVLDVNLRFGGGYPLAHECGCDFMGLILNNLDGIANKKQIVDYGNGVSMMKYSDIIIRRESERLGS